jgi:processive 1,2-diacylglycerol beta-glucosyltransferase
MSSKKILFLEASGGGGHISITTAIIQALQKIDPAIQTVRADVMPPFAHKLYQLASRQFVNAFLLLYKATDNQQGELFASRLNGVVSREKLTKTIVEANPDLVFSNYSLAVSEIPKILEKIDKPIPFIVFVPDPFTVHAIYLSKKANLTLVSTLAAYQSALRSGISPQKLEITGHPIREEFASIPKDIKALRKQLGLDPDAFTIFFGGSGHGAEKTLEILIHLGAKPTGTLIKRLIRSANLDYKTYYKLFFRIFRRQYKNMPPFQAICVCGDNTELKEDLEMLKYPPYLKPFIYLHADNIDSLMHASDLIVGKAGPNVMFESVMAGKPFLATYHIKGQEDGNIDFIKSVQFGFVEENPQKTAYLIETILKNKELLDRTRPGISFVREEHKDAATKIANLILKNLNKP